MPRGPLDILEKVLGIHAQVVTKPSLSTSGQLTINNDAAFDKIIYNLAELLIVLLLKSFSNWLDHVTFS